MHILELLHPNHTSVPTAIMLAISCADLAITRLELLTYGTVWWSGLTLPLMPHSVRCVPSPSIVLCHCIHTLRNVNWLWPCSCFGAVIIGCRDYIKNKRKKKKKKIPNLLQFHFSKPSIFLTMTPASIKKPCPVDWAIAAAGLTGYTEACGQPRQPGPAAAHTPRQKKIDTVRRLC